MKYCILLSGSHHCRDLESLINKYLLKLISNNEPSMSTSMIWIFGFSILLLALHLVYPVIFRYIDEKPMGRQSLFDLVLKDHFMISRYNGTIYCLVAIASRLEWFESATDIRDVTALALSAIYDFSFIFGCVNLSLVCLFRTACLVNVSRVEETFGERSLRATLVASSAALAMSGCLVVIVTGDIKTGLPYNFITRMELTVGNAINI